MPLWCQWLAQLFCTQLVGVRILSAAPIYPSVAQRIERWSSEPCLVDVRIVSEGPKWRYYSADIVSNFGSTVGYIDTSMDIRSTNTNLKILGQVGMFGTPGCL